MLRVWGRRNSINVQKVLWLVGELGLAHEHIPAGGDFGRLNDPDFVALNPHRRIPVLEDGGLAIWESHAILRYLASAYGDAAWWPGDSGRRAVADGWMDWQLASLQPAFIGGVFWDFYRTPPEQRDGAAISRSLARCAVLFGRLDAVLKDQPYLSGDALGLADIPAGSCLYRYYELEIERADLPHLEAWYDRLCDRPAYREHVMLPFGDLQGRLAF